MEKFKLQLSKLMDKYNFELIEFSYYKKIFGNIVLKIRINEKEFYFITDRGDIYCNNKLLHCVSIYHFILVLKRGF